MCVRVKMVFWLGGNLSAIGLAEEAVATLVVL